MSEAATQIADDVIQVLAEPQELPKPSNKSFLYKNSALLGSEVEAEAKKEFHGYRGPTAWAIQTEKPEHKMVLWLTAQGKTPKEVAEITGYSYPYVLQIRNQPWFAVEIARVLKEAGQNEVQAMLSGEAVASLQTLVEMRDTAPKAGDRIKAADSLLDRFLGRPIQALNITHQKPVEQRSVEISEELKQIEEEEKRLLEAKTTLGV